MIKWMRHNSVGVQCAYLIFDGNAKTINCVFHTYVIVLWALNGYKNQDHHNPNHGCMFR